MKKLLDPKWIESTKCLPKAGQPQLDIYDTHHNGKGLCLRTSSAGSRVWYFCFTSPTPPKKSARLKMGDFPGISLAAARIAIADMRAQVDGGKDPRDAPAPTGDMTIAQLFDLRFKNVLALDADNYHKTCLAQERVMDVDVLPLVGPVLAKDFDIKHLQLVIQPLVDRGAVTQSRRVFEMVRALINYGVEIGQIPYSKIAKSKPTGKEKVGDKSLSLTQLRQLWTTVDSVLSGSDHVPLIIKIAIATGKRSHEIRGCDYEKEIDEKNMLWTIPLERVKGEVGATEDELVPLSPLALSLFKEAKRRTNHRLLFSCDHGEDYISATTISHAIRRAQHRFTLKDDVTGKPITFKLKDIRATVGTQVLNKKNGLGITRFEKYLMLNHLSAIYANVSDKHYDQNDYLDEKRDAMNKWGAFLEKLIAEGEVKYLQAAE